MSQERAARTCECRACRNDWGELTGIDRESLSKLNAEGDTEAAHDMAADLTEHGEVKFRPAGWTDQVAQILARSVTEDCE